MSQVSQGAGDTVRTCYASPFALYGELFYCPAKPLRQGETRPVYEAVGFAQAVYVQAAGGSLFLSRPH